MTLVIAQLCRNGAAVMCSDSQATAGSEWKTLSAKKIHIINKRNPPLVVGVAGNPSYGGYAVRQLLKLEEYSIEAVEETVGQVYEKFIDREVKRGSNGLGYVMSVILQEEKALRIYRISEEGVGEPVSEPPYLCMGSGTVWADWLMSEFGKTVLNSSEALELASYVIGMTSQVDPNVGGNVQAVKVVLPSKLGIAIPVAGESYSSMLDTSSKKRRLLQAFWYAIGNKEIRALMEKQLKGIAEMNKQE